MLHVAAVQINTLLAELVAFGVMSPQGLDTFMATRDTRCSNSACCHLGCGCALSVMQAVRLNLRSTAVYRLAEASTGLVCS